MKVWILTRHFDCEGTDIIGVYATIQDAEADFYEAVGTLGRRDAEVQIQAGEACTVYVAGDTVTLEPHDVQGQVAIQ